ncbi:MAG: response regulator transcription factor [Massilia sp.]
MPQKKPHLLLVEDDAHFAAWVTLVLASHFPPPQLVAAASCAQALQAFKDGQAAHTPWGMAIVDLNLPDGSGINVIRALAQGAPAVPILVVTAVEEPDVALAAIRAGASGYIVKATMDTDLLRTVEQVLAGGSPITPAIARRLLLAFHEQAPAEPHAEAAVVLPELMLEKITERETEVLRLLARGYGNKEIASRLGFSANTADSHVRSIYRKLSVNSRAQLRSLLTE